MPKFPHLLCIEKLFQGFLELVQGEEEKMLKSHLNNILYLLLRMCTYFKILYLFLGIFKTGGYVLYVIILGQ